MTVVQLGTTQTAVEFIQANTCPGNLAHTSQETQAASRLGVLCMWHLMPNLLVQIQTSALNPTPGRARLPTAVREG